MKFFVIIINLLLLVFGGCDLSKGKNKDKNKVEDKLEQELASINKLEQEVNDLFDKFDGDSNYEHIRAISQKLNLGITQDDINDMIKSSNSSRFKDRVTLSKRNYPYGKQSYEKSITLRDLIEGTLYKQKIAYLFKKYDFAEDLNTLNIIDFRKLKDLEKFSIMSKNNKQGYNTYKSLYDANKDLF